MSMLAYLLPLTLFAAAIVCFTGPGLRPRRSLAIVEGAALAVLAGAVIFGTMAATYGAAGSALIGANGIGLQIRVDAVSAVMVLLVSFIGWVVIRYARTYMDGDARQGTFMGRLALTLGFVLLLVTSGNVGQLVLAWIGTSLSMHRLLLFYGDRPVARLAAGKKFLFARIGDVFLISAAVLLVQGFGTGEIAAMSAALDEGLVPQGTGWAAFCIAMAALLKSAQFPTHGWLTEVMDAPTPVSALLHAGVINAGGFLVIRFSDIFLAAPGFAMALLAVVGGLTAALASLVMLTQTAVKSALAWSTAAQMGFMLLQCGLGAFPAALLHIVAHSLYKAHAFLGSGSVVDLARAKLGHRLSPVRPRDAVLSLAVALCAVGLTGWAFGVTLETKPALVVLAAILVLGLAQLVALSMGQGARGPLVIRASLVSFGLSAVYFALQLGAETLTAGTLPETGSVGPMLQVVMGMILALFVATAAVQILAPVRLAEGRWRPLVTHLRQGLYVTPVLNRLLAPKLA
ncbi:proton-conducting transporter membrane subunit [Roseibacterium sp. SDUM158016]|uniref:proton-conducting transporter transmembrane domain-containing protein n=1 Tax=Roseicyclus sediminis TaxID=2980997 RepID=UPI0021CF4F6D|nr:proton-conducting transporter membrane subunit [Roseibacterium sp. SDUM158016]MCU4653940.1 proton-conducting transporter membrane subunit [Roseibacterium sp. SDUM158016]